MCLAACILQLFPTFVIQTHKMEPGQNLPQEESQLNQIAEYHDDIRKIELEGYELGVKKARNALFWSAAILLIWQVLAIAISGAEFTPEVFVIIIPFVIGFILLGVWTKHKPYTAIIIGICLFFAYWALVVITNVMYSDGEGIFKSIIGGWWIKLIILINLFRPLKDAKELQQAKDEKKF